MDCREDEKILGNSSTEPIATTEFNATISRSSGTSSSESENNVQLRAQPHPDIISSDVVTDGVENGSNPNGCNTNISENGGIIPIIKNTTSMVSTVGIVAATVTKNLESFIPTPSYRPLPQSIARITPTNNINMTSSSTTNVNSCGNNDGEKSNHSCIDIVSEEKVKIHVENHSEVENRKDLLSTHDSLIEKTTQQTSELKNLVGSPSSKSLPKTSNLEAIIPNSQNVIQVTIISPIRESSTSSSKRKMSKRLAYELKLLAPYNYDGFGVDDNADGETGKIRRSSRSGRSTRKNQTPSSMNKKEKDSSSKMMQSSSPNSSLSPTTKIPAQSTVQLFASDFDVVSILQQQKEAEDQNGKSVAPLRSTTTTQSQSTTEIAPVLSKRPKRRIKQVIKYQPSTRNYKQECKLREIAGKVGTGFLCPSCNMHLSYDAKICWSCGLPCCYVPGTGVVVCKDRDSISKNEMLMEKDIELDDSDKVEEVGNVGASIATSNMRSSRKRSIYEIAPPTSSSARAYSDLPLRDKKGKFVAKRTLLPTCTSIKSSNAKTKTFLLNDTVAECEACLKLFSSTYIQRHRQTYHGLPPEYFGCAYCEKSFFTMKERRQHIEKDHKGKPHCLPEKLKETGKIYLYNCHACDADPMTYLDLKKHLSKHHKIEMSNVLNEITASCPFCLKTCADLKKRKIFKTMDSLLGHLASSHKGCELIGRRINIGPEINISEGEEDKEEEGRREYYSHSKNDIQPLYKDDEESSVNDDLPPPEKHWHDLSYDHLRDLFLLDKNVVKRDQTYDSLLHFVDRKLKKITYLEECHQLTQKSSGNGVPGYDDEYITENKLYVRGLRERSGKAASEALEKMTFKNQWEENNLKYQYENRNIKKSAEDLEIDALIERPFRFVSITENNACSSTRATKRNNVCKIGPLCGLCNAAYAKYIITDKEIEEAGGKITSVLPIGHDSKKNQVIRHLNHWPIADKDLPNDREDDTEENGRNKSHSKRSKGRRKNAISNDSWMEYWKLMELRHSMDFIREYNEGLFQPLLAKR